MRSFRRNLSAFTIAICALAVGVRTVSSADCNRNGFDDAADLLPQSLGFGAPTYPVDGRPLLLIAADLDGDGSSDFVTLNEGFPPVVGDVSVLINKGNGTFQQAAKYPVGQSPVDLIATDINDDGRPDLAAANRGSNDVSVLLNRGDGTFTSCTFQPVGQSPVQLIAVDFQGDGRIDLATVGDICPSCCPPTAGAVSVLLGRGNGTFGIHCPLKTPGLGRLRLTGWSKDRLSDLRI